MRAALVAALGAASVPLCIAETGSGSGDDPDRSIDDWLRTEEVQVSERLTPADPSRTFTCSLADCDLMKVHFDHFRVPSGATVAVCGARQADGRQECYTYGHGAGQATRDKSRGEDGKTCFGAMSVDGALVTVALRAPPALQGLWDAEQHIVSVGRISQFSTGRVASDGRAAQSLSVCGSVGYKDVACYRDSHPTHYARSMAVARLLIGFTNKLCTGWRVSQNNLMMTAEHCIGDQEMLESAEWHFNYQRSGCREGSASDTLKVLGGTVIKSDGELDFSLSTLSPPSYYAVSQWRGPNGELIGYLDVSAQDPAVGTRVYIPQHALGLTRKLAIEEDRPSGYCEVRNLDPQGDWSSFKIGYRCDTQGGSSGSPIIRSSDHSVIALHSNGGCTEDGMGRTNKGTRMSHIRLLILNDIAVTAHPTALPGTPTAFPSAGAAFSAWPTHQWGLPSGYPTGWPRSNPPVGVPAIPTGFPVYTGYPTTMISTGYPRTGFPWSGFPTRLRTGFPSTGFPTRTGFPSRGPTGFPVRTGFPSRHPTGFPSKSPTGFPSRTGYPSRAPTGYPSRSPTGYPVRTGYPSGHPTGTEHPSGGPTGHPTAAPSVTPGFLTVVPQQLSTWRPTTRVVSELPPVTRLPGMDESWEAHRQEGEPVQDGQRRARRWGPRRGSRASGARLRGPSL